ncbi:selenoprotein H-like [Cucurbita pepo subsp. pepo]|uniref:selenoprotein H-like n=1 Tax=Cucurbita pepo subsp. pepo TaxID=3664 RepID=UPI000C9D2E18|nr:selenoprotein H-like [Cucurbita pepo subsp. pepo]
MAPRKRSKNQEHEIVAAEEKPAPVSSMVTRRSPRLAVNSKADLVVEEAVTELPKSKKVKRAPKENGKAKEVGNEGEEIDAASKKLSKDAKNRTVVIEFCKQCQSFKKRAIQVQSGLENGVSGITVLLNPNKPRKGCFEIRSDDGEKFISLLDMKRPFTRMKELNMEEVISDMIEKIKG